ARQREKRNKPSKRRPEAIRGTRLLPAGLEINEHLVRLGTAPHADKQKDAGSERDETDRERKNLVAEPRDHSRIDHRYRDIGSDAEQEYCGRAFGSGGRVLVLSDVLRLPAANDDRDDRQNEDRDRDGRADILQPDVPATPEACTRDLRGHVDESF